MGFLSNLDSGLSSGLLPYKNRQFSDPFMLPSNEHFPTRMDNMWDWCAHLWYINALYRQASKRVCSHFITDIEFRGDAGDDRERRFLKEYLYDQLQIKRILLRLGAEWAAYGNGFAWTYMPFNRYLVDQRNSDHLREWPLENFSKMGEVRYNHKTMTYTVVDPLTLGQPEKKRKTIDLPFRDRVTMDLERIKVILLDPRQVTLNHSFWSDETSVIWRFDQEFLSDIQQNRLHQINGTPMAMLKAISKDEDFAFHPGEVFHLKADSITGVSNMGWGFPEVLANYRELHQLQVYRKIDEAVGLDYMLPFRMFSMTDNPQGTDGAMRYLLGSAFEQQAERIIANRRANPFAIHAAAFPMKYDEYGGNGKSLVPHENLEWQTGNVLDAAGYPAELFRGSMAIQQIPTALRLFENSFIHLSGGFDLFVKWITKRIQRHASLEDISVYLAPPSIANNIEQLPMFFQVAAGGEIPRDYPWRHLGIDDPEAAFRQRKLQDASFQRIEQEVADKVQREAQMGSMSEQVANGAAGANPAAGGNLTPLDTMRQAEQEAQTIVQMDPGSQQRQWDTLRAGDPVYYALVKQKSEEYRRGAESQGRASLRQGPTTG